MYKIQKKKKTGNDHWSSLNSKLVNITIESKKLFKDAEKMPPEIPKHVEVTKDFFRSTMRKVFLKYMASQYWKDVVDKVRSNAGNKCYDCGYVTDNGICHHTSYKNWGKGSYEEIADCVWLCQKCHTNRHNKHIDEDTPFWAERNFSEYIIEEEDLKKLFMNEL